MRGDGCRLAYICMYVNMPKFGGTCVVCNIFVYCMFGFTCYRMLCVRVWFFLVSVSTTEPETEHDGLGRSTAMTAFSVFVDSWKALAGSGCHNEMIPPGPTVLEGRCGGPVVVDPRACASTWAISSGPVSIIFLMVCRNRRLHPFKEQVFLVWVGYEVYKGNDDRHNHHHQHHRW